MPKAKRKQQPQAKQMAMAAFVGYYLMASLHQQGYKAGYAAAKRRYGKKGG